MLRWDKLDDCAPPKVSDVCLKLGRLLFRLASNRDVEGFTRVIMRSNIILGHRITKAAVDVYYDLCYDP